jgi:hypothetical protein
MTAAQLKDIHGLDPISWWPPAAGWWIAGGLLLLVATLLFLWIRHLIHYPPGSWRNEARKALSDLRRRRYQLTSKDAAGALSELLRRIAIARFGRHGQASLSGEEWLLWLQQNDPNGFNWGDRGQVLLSLPYAPDDWVVDQSEVDSLIIAAQELVANSREDAQRPRGRWRTLLRQWRGGWGV